MPIIELQQKMIELKAEDERNRGLVVVEPCHPGYGISDREFTAESTFILSAGRFGYRRKIKGATHEFMTLPHIQEDVLEIILNLPTCLA